MSSKVTTMLVPYARDKTLRDIICLITSFQQAFEKQKVKIIQSSKTSLSLCHIPTGLVLAIFCVRITLIITWFCILMVYGTR